MTVMYSEDVSFKRVMNLAPLVLNDLDHSPREASVPRPASHLRSKGTLKQLGLHMEKNQNRLSSPKICSNPVSPRPVSRNLSFNLYNEEDWSGKEENEASGSRCESISISSSTLINIAEDDINGYGEGFDSLRNLKQEKPKQHSENEPKLFSTRPQTFHFNKIYQQHSLQRRGSFSRASQIGNRGNQSPLQKSLAPSGCSSPLFRNNRDRDLRFQESLKVTSEEGIGELRFQQSFKLSSEDPPKFQESLQVSKTQTKNTEGLSFSNEEEPASNNGLRLRGAPSASVVSVPKNTRVRSFLRLAKGDALSGARNLDTWGETDQEATPHHVPKFNISASIRDSVNASPSNSISGTPKRRVQVDDDDDDVQVVFGSMVTNMNIPLQNHPQVGLVASASEYESPLTATRKGSQSKRTPGCSSSSISTNFAPQVTVDYKQLFSNKYRIETELESIPESEKENEVTPRGLPKDVLSDPPILQ